MCIINITLGSTNVLKCPRAGIVTHKKDGIRLLNNIIFSHNKALHKRLLLNMFHMGDISLVHTDSVPIYKKTIT